MSSNIGADSVTFTPIGYIRTAHRVKFAAPHQPAQGADEGGVIELLPDQGFETALRDLAGFERIWLVWWFHKNKSWRPMVLPPRGEPRRRGLFATRSPHRPNPIGITCVPLLGIDGLRLRIGPCDLVDGTPIFDIKPYLHAVDSYPNARAGWIDDLEARLAQSPRYAIQFSPLAEAQAAWLEEQCGRALIVRVVALLEHDPKPHRTRRIRALNERLFRMGCGAWRVFFSVQGMQVTVEYFEPGFPESYLNDERLTRIPDREAQIAFRTTWPSEA